MTEADEVCGPIEAVADAQRHKNMEKDDDMGHTETYLLLNWGLPLLVKLLAGKAAQVNPDVVGEVTDIAKDPVGTLKEIDKDPAAKESALNWLVDVLKGIL